MLNDHIDYGKRLSRLYVHNRVVLLITKMTNVYFKNSYPNATLGEELKSKYVHIYVKD